MSTPPNGTGTSHTGDPSQVRVTVPPGAPAVSAPNVDVPPPGPEPVPGAKSTPPSHQANPNDFLRQQTAHVEQLHDEVLSLDVLMELHTQAKRTQQMLLVLAVIVAGAALAGAVGRARAIDLGEE